MPSLSEGWYAVLTPFGVVHVDFPDESGNVYDGDPSAIHFLKSVMRDQTDRDGMMIDPNTVNPPDFYYFCQPKGSGVTITPPIDDAIFYAQEEAKEE